MNVLDNFVSWHVRGCQVGDGECTCGMEEAKAELAQLRSENAKLCALLAEKYEIYLQNCAEIDRLNSENDKLRQTICIDETDRPTRLWKLFDDNKHLRAGIADYQKTIDLEQKRKIGLERVSCQLRASLALSELATEEQIKRNSALLQQLAAKDAALEEARKIIKDYFRFAQASGIDHRAEAWLSAHPKAGE